MVEEVLRGDDRHVGAGVHHPEHAAEVVEVRMGVDHRGDRPVAAVLAVQRQPGRGHLGRNQRIDDDDPGLALDQGHVRQVDSAQLVDAVGDLEQHQRAEDKRHGEAREQVSDHRLWGAHPRLREKIARVLRMLRTQ